MEQPLKHVVDGKKARAIRGKLGGEEAVRRCCDVEGDHAEVLQRSGGAAGPRKAARPRKVVGAKGACHRGAAGLRKVDGAKGAYREVLG